ncbi:MAG TPA: pyridoxamine 5'-phosphate oxidase [Chitinophagales bacterium]|jgi:pyridoxamine 5'-phosphate oxidase|nr:pyridoxamine 5'-phosphate oxidase [Chitinophagales bacterium]HQW79875.1 pyridoxamine 5'-phosphate oxidase [Chitinophagales bacterium]HRB19850.1 pyridoxamine 5'-phosphate oxidase [Chitinophagales bacterium]HRB67399.1 pyridoxamine 5'-phosphate oxidase [Chitinophagales bacterium]
MANRDLNNMRESYDAFSLLEHDCNSNPFKQFDKWFQHAIDAKEYEPNAMQLATVGVDGQPSIRTVLLKSFDINGFVFFTNYNSRKGQQIQENAKVTLLFWYREQQRQIRVEGIATKTSLNENDIYFHSRPRESQIAAYVSKQSQVVENRTVLDDLFTTKEIEFKNQEVPMLENWGGFKVTPTLFEFWQGRVSRLHDRIQYTKIEDTWKMERLMP